MPLYLKIPVYIFSPLILMYTAIIYLRNRLYDWSIFKTCISPLPTISVGNIQIGGTGKTPMVEYLAGKLKEKSVKPAIITRGYRRRMNKPVLVDPADPHTIQVEVVGDEPFMLVCNLPDIPLVVNVDRCKAAILLKQIYPESIILLDDGFQHRRISRNFDIVLIDVTRWPECGLLFPLSSLRDVKSSLKRAHALVLTRTGQAPGKTEILKEQFSRRFKVPVFTAEITPQEIIGTGEKRESLPLKVLSGKKVAAFCGIGNPSQFFSSIEHTGAELCWKKTFPDHHFYTADDINAIIGESEKCGAEYIITTQKDSVKMNSVRSGRSGNIYFLKISLSVNQENHLFSLIEKAIQKATGRDI